jgi:hypothetical protein
MISGKLVYSIMSIRIFFFVKQSILFDEKVSLKIKHYLNKKLNFPVG